MNSVIIPVLNGVCEVLGKFNRVTELVGPAALGAIGGFGSNIGVQRGFLQGVMTGGWNIFVLPNCKKWVDKNSQQSKDVDPTKLTPTTQNVLYTIGTISTVVFPIFIMNKLGDDILNKAASCLSIEKQAWILPSKASAEYSITKGLLTQIMPDLLSIWLSLWGK